MFKFALYILLFVGIFYNWNLFIPESWYATNVGAVDDIILSYGFPIENHSVQTEDGYILTLHRIPHGKNGENHKNKARPPVFLMPGLGCSSVEWIIKGPDSSMGTILADAGYDVWMGNNRGNTYSRKHVTLNPELDKEEFFNYSYHEIGQYDLPAMIDYVLNSTGYKQLTYLGFSQGFTLFLVMNSLKPEYNDKILLMNGFAPVSNMHNVSSSVFNFLKSFPKVIEFAEYIGMYELFPITTTPFIRLLCTSETFCNFTFGLIGASSEQLPNKEKLISILANFPAGFSLKQLAHYVQGMRTGVFGHFDYGKRKNLQVYGSPDVPLYDLTKVTAPIILYYGENDIFVNNHILLNTVYKELRNVTKTFLVPYPDFNHVDFVFGKDIRLLTEEALKNINEFNKLTS